MNAINQIELTSKKWKGMKVVSLLLIWLVAPIFYGNNAESFAWVVFTIGIILYVTARLGAWWNHG